MEQPTQSNAMRETAPEGSITQTAERVRVIVPLTPDEAHTIQDEVAKLSPGAESPGFRRPNTIY